MLHHLPELLKPQKGNKAVSYFNFLENKLCKFKIIIVPLKLFVMLQHPSSASAGPAICTGGKRPSCEHTCRPA